MPHNLRKYIKLDAIEFAKITCMTILLSMLLPHASKAYSSHLILHPSQLEALEEEALQRRNGEGTDATFISASRFPSDPIFSLPKVLEVLKNDRSRLVWFTYPASVRGRVFFGFAPDASPSVVHRLGGGW